MDPNSTGVSGMIHVRVKGKAAGTTRLVLPLGYPVEAGFEEGADDHLRHLPVPRLIWRNADQVDGGCQLVKRLTGP